MTKAFLFRKINGWDIFWDNKLSQCLLAVDLHVCHNRLESSKMQMVQEEK
tara:strand:+ start:139 stop:288 length:150 start_codon:yes stop_codon:yes gene_type:complete